MKAGAPAPVAPAQLKALFAVLIDHFHLTPEQYARLTDRQLLELYSHKRDKQGAIKSEVPAAQDPLAIKARDVKTVEDALANLEILGAALHMPADQLEEARRKVREKWKS